MTPSPCVLKKVWNILDRPPLLSQRPPSITPTVRIRSPVPACSKVVHKSRPLVRHIRPHPVVNVGVPLVICVPERHVTPIRPSCTGRTIVPSILTSTTHGYEHIRPSTSKNVFESAGLGVCAGMSIFWPDPCVLGLDAFDG